MKVFRILMLLILGLGISSTSYGVSGESKAACFKVDKVEVTAVADIVLTSYSLVGLSYELSDSDNSTSVKRFDLLFAEADLDFNLWIASENRWRDFRTLRSYQHTNFRTSTTDQSNRIRYLTNHVGKTC